MCAGQAAGMALCMHTSRHRRFCQLAHTHTCIHACRHRRFCQLAHTHKQTRACMHPGTGGSASLHTHTHTHTHTRMHASRHKRFCQLAHTHTHTSTLRKGIANKAVPLPHVASMQRVRLTSRSVATAAATDFWGGGWSTFSKNEDAVPSPIRCIWRNEKKR